MYPWGHPIFLLNAKAQGGKLPKWEPCSRVGICSDYSPKHAGKVVMILDHRTINFSPQHHVVFDDNSSTVPSMVNGEIPDNWLTLVKQSEEHRDEAENDLTNL